MCTVLPVVGVGKGGRVLIDPPGYLKAVLLFIGAQPIFPYIPGVPLPALRRSRCGRGGSEGLTPQCTPGYGGYAPMHFTLVTRATLRTMTLTVTTGFVQVDVRR